MSLKKILRVLLIVGLPLLLTACSNSSGIWSSDVDGNAASANTDISIGFLGQLFGTVGSSLQGYNSQLLGKLFYQFNMGILIVIGVFLIYTVLTSALRGANEGSFVGQGKNVAYNCLKIGLGVGMILPNATTGYCLAQELMMEVTVAGVHLADNVWNTALTYLDSGHAIWTDPNDSSNKNKASSIINEDSFNAFMGDPKDSSENPLIKRLGYNVMLSEVCMLSYDVTAPVLATGGDGTSANLYYSRYEFPSSKTPGDAGCGSVDWSKINKLIDKTNNDSGSKCVSGNYGDADSEQLCQIGQNAVLAMINDIMPAATAYYCSRISADRSADPKCSAYQNNDKTYYDEDIENDLYMADIDYTNQIFGAYDLMSLSSSGDFKKAKNSGQSDGWMMAGRYYWDMAEKSQANMSGNISDYNATQDNGGAITSGSVNGWDKGVIQDYLGSAQTKAVDYANALDGANSSSTDTSGVNFGNDDVGKFFLGPFYKIISLFTAAGAVANPVNWLMQLGQTCIQEAGVIWQDTLVAMGMLVLGTAAMSCISPAGYAAETVASWIRPLVLAVAGLLVGAGMVLGYYVPLYPFMIFTFGVIGWFVAVIEAMAAAPLVAFGLTHPEGHDFLGKAEQAIMLALSVFLRPVLMILGLISGMILSFIAFKMVNYSFCSFMQDLFLGSGNAVGSASDSSNIAGAIAVAWGNSFVSSGSLFVFLFSFPALLVLYAVIVMEVTHQCYALIYKLPDYIMRWVGAPNTSSPVEVEKLASGVKSAASSAASGVHQGMEKSESRGDSALQKGKEGSGSVGN